jgi:hypothetical protein
MLAEGRKQKEIGVNKIFSYVSSPEGKMNKIIK